MPPAPGDAAAREEGLPLYRYLGGSKATDLGLVFGQPFSTLGGGFPQFIEFCRLRDLHRPTASTLRTPY